MSDPTLIAKIKWLGSEPPLKCLIWFNRLSDDFLINYGVTP